MKIKVVKSGMKSYWYSNHIGEIFDVYEKPDRDGDFELIQNEEDLKHGGFMFVRSDVEILEKHK